MDLLLDAQRTDRRRPMRGYTTEWRAGGLLLAFDACLVLLLVALWQATAEHASGLAGAATVASFILFPAAKLLAGLYPGHGLSRAQRLRQVCLAAAGAFVLVMGLAAFMARLGDAPLPAALVPAGLVAAMLLVISDPIARRALVRLGRWCQPVFIFGGGDTAGEVVRQLKLYPHLGLAPVCIVDDSSVYIPEEEHGVPVVRFKELSRHADALAHATTAVAVERLVERSLILQLYTTGIFQRILLVPACHDLISLKSKVRRVGGMLSIELASDRPRPTAALGKRAFDVTVGSVALVLLSPLMAGIALWVAFDSPGPILFSQPRWAGESRTFQALKFRTMHTDGDQRLKRHFLRNPAAERLYEKYRKLDNDPRVTRAGRFLRATSLDELPQLINVLRGEMSLVGPRPYTMDELSRLGPARQILGLTRPGISGFWQVSGRNQRTFRERIEMDCYYVRNLAIWLDLWILYRTVVAVVTREGK
jgi:Undecaprenyl-phosphate galactose phosphotransferase WbaP